MKAKLMVILVIAALVLPMTALAQDKTEVTLWFHSGQGSERDALADQIERFNAQSEEYEVVPIEVPEGSYSDQVSAAALAGDLPCVLDFDGPNVYAYVASGDLIALDEYFSEDLLSDVLPSIIDQGTVDGQLYSLGQFDSGLALWGNRAMLEEAGVRIPEGIDDPWTLDEFNAALEALAAVVPEDGYVIDLQFNSSVNGTPTPSARGLASATRSTARPTRRLKLPERPGGRRVWRVAPGAVRGGLCHRDPG